MIQPVDSNKTNLAENENMQKFMHVFAGPTFIFFPLGHRMAVLIYVLLSKHIVHDLHTR